MRMTPGRNDSGENSLLDQYVATQSNLASIVTAAMGLAVMIVLFGVVVLICCYAEDDYRKLLADLIAVQGSSAVGFVLAGAGLYMQCADLGRARYSGIAVIAQRRLPAPECARCQPLAGSLAGHFTGGQ
jgi:hypothetical protein